MAVWSGPGEGWNPKESDSDKESGKSGTDVGVSGSGGAEYGTFGGNVGADDDGDGDDQPHSDGTADGHADVVPSGGDWPAITK